MAMGKVIIRREEVVVEEKPVAAVQSPVVKVTPVQNDVVASADKPEQEGAGAVSAKNRASSEMAKPDFN
jgi:ribonuclease E